MRERGRGEENVRICIRRRRRRRRERRRKGEKGEREARKEGQKRSLAEEAASEEGGTAAVVRVSVGENIAELGGNKMRRNWESV